MTIAGKRRSEAPLTETPFDASRDHPVVATPTLAPAQ